MIKVIGDGFSNWFRKKHKESLGGEEMSIVRTFNYSKDTDYHTQLNNRLVPFEACCATSLAMACYQAGMPEKLNVNDALDDVFMALALSENGYKAQKNLAAWSVGIYKPFEVHAVMEWAVNFYYRRLVDKFSTHNSMADIIFALLNRKGVVMSGDFDYRDGITLGHVVSIAGFTSSQIDIEEVQSTDEIDLTAIEEIIIDDPFGDYRTIYRSSKGNDIPMPYSEFIQKFKARDNRLEKWAHIVSL